jgi:DNA-binding HxlR family transcriptional regulator
MSLDLESRSGQEDARTSGTPHVPTVPQPNASTSAPAEQRAPAVATAHLRAALDVMRRRWRAEVVWCLRGGALRFNAILAALTPVSHKVLTEQLRALERAGVVARELGPGGGRHVEYRLTPLGTELPPILERLGAWGAAHEHTMRERSARAIPLHNKHNVTGRRA